MAAKHTYTEYLNRRISIGKKAFLSGKYGLDSIMLDVANTYQPQNGVASTKYFGFVKALAAYNDAFILLYKKGNLYGAMAMNRILMEHLIYLYADYLYPKADIINKVYNEGKELNQIRVNGEKIKPSEVRNRLYERYGWCETVWQRYHLYIHPSVNTGSVELEIQPLEGDKRGAKAVTVHSVDYLTLSKAISDIVKINNAILYTFRDIRDDRIRILKESGLIKAYIESYYTCRGGRKRKQPIQLNGLAIFLLNYDLVDAFYRYTI